VRLGRMGPFERLVGTFVETASNVLCPTECRLELRAQIQRSKNKRRLSTRPCLDSARQLPHSWVICLRYGGAFRVSTLDFGS